MQYRDEKTRLFAETVGKVVKDLRLAKGYSINKFAHDYGLDVGNTSRIEKGCPYSCDMTISNQTMTNICPLYLKQFLLPVFLLFRYFLQH